MRTTMARRHTQRGFTLAEILVTTAIFAIIMLAALAVYDRSNQVFKTSAEAADMQQSTRIGFDKLVSEVRIAGFDYDRGGAPSGAGEYEQPDEQIEYAGASAIVFRSNFDYDTNPTNGNGMECCWTSTGLSSSTNNYYAINQSTNQPFFPYITTGNDEVVAYVLRSNSGNSSANKNSISFWIDSSIPRRAYPVNDSTAGSYPGQAESQVTISGIDTTNIYPPYTLYRMTLTDVLNKGLGTPVADNIRSVNFAYYTDSKATSLLKNPDGTAITASRNADGTTDTMGGNTTLDASGTGAIGGDGRYDPFNVGTTSNFNDRTQRSTIEAVKIQLVGMNANEDTKYTNPVESNTAGPQYTASALHYRTYALQSTVVPRNLGHTGFAEPNYNPPGPPSITGICTGLCGAPIICWSPPSTGGTIDKYTISWDTNPNGTFLSSMDVTDPTATMATLVDNGTYDVSQTYYYRIVAVNDNGASNPSNVYAATPINSTVPAPVTNVTASGGTAGYAAQVNQITLGWTPPTTNTTTTMNCTGTCGGSGTAVVPQEVLVYSIWRSTNPSFTPGDSSSVQVLSWSGNGIQPAPGATTWVDGPSTSAAPPATCVTYYYRIQVANRCIRQPSWNSPTTLSVSAYTPAVSGAAQSATAATLGTTPATPVGLNVNTAVSICPASNSSNCTITLTWPKVTLDTASPANPISVDTYQIKRQRKTSEDSSYYDDPNFIPTPLTLPTNYSQSTAGTLSWTDTTAPAYTADGETPYYYAYQIRAVTCSVSSAWSLPAYFPGACNLSPTITPSGGTTPSSPVIVEGGEAITVTPPSGVTYSGVKFVVTPYSSGASITNKGTYNISGGSLVAQPSAVNGAYTMNWVDEAQGTYMVVIYVTSSDGKCTEVHVRYFEENPPAPCGSITFPTPTFTDTKSGSTRIVQMSFQNITNTEAGPLYFYNGSFIGSEAATWGNPSPGYPDLTMTAVQWNSTPSTSITNAGPIGTTSSLTSTTQPPTSLVSVAQNSKFTLTLQWTYSKTSDTVPMPGAISSNPSQTTLDLTKAPLKKLCIAFQVPAVSTQTSYCNIYGQSATTNNPNSCD